MADKKTLSYKEQLNREILNPPDHLWLNDNEPHVVLQREAERMFDQGTKEGRIAALDIYSHLVEEILKILLKYIRFILKLLSYPERINDLDLEKKSLGNLTLLIEDSIGFEGKDLILQQSNKIRTKRNHLMHNLIKAYHDIDILRDTDEIKNIYDELQETFLYTAIYSLGRIINELKNREALVHLIEDSDT